MNPSVQSKGKNEHKGSFSDRLRSSMTHRRESNLSLARAVGTSHTSVARWLKGTPVGMEMALKLAEALNVRVQWLLAGEGEMEEPSSDAAIMRQLEGGPAGAASSMSEEELVEALGEWSGMVLSETKRRMRAAKLESLIAFACELHKRDLANKQHP